MLTADLVRTRKKGGELFVTELSDKVRPRALELAQGYLALAEAHVGASRAELEEAWEGVKVGASERKLALGLCKLVEDRVQFDVQSELDPRLLRSEVFEAAASLRQQLHDDQVFDRAAFLAAQASQRGLSPEQLERLLYADLRAAQVLTGFLALSPEHLVQSYDLAQKQAVFLRAVALVAEVRCRDPYAYRILFRKLKFFRLMHRIEPRPDGYLLYIDGPFSLFAASTKYGLELALALPSILSCDEYSIVAQLRWGKEREALSFKLQGKGRPILARAPEGELRPNAGEIAVPDEVATFLKRFRGLESEWEAEISSDILEVRGVGLCVPDVRFVSRETGEVAYLEVLGYWSRDAVWKRVELAANGLKERVIFAASSKLRVSEEVIDENVPAQLYMHKGTLSPKEVLRRLSGSPQSQ